MYLYPTDKNNWKGKEPSFRGVGKRQAMGCFNGSWWNALGLKYAGQTAAHVSEVPKNGDESSFSVFIKQRAGGLLQWGAGTSIVVSIGWFLILSMKSKQIVQPIPWKQMTKRQKGLLDSPSYKRVVTARLKQPKGDWYAPVQWWRDKLTAAIENDDTPVAAPQWLKERQRPIELSSSCVPRICNVCKSCLADEIVRLFSDLL